MNETIDVSKLGPDAEMELIAKNTRARLTVQQKEIFGEWIEKRKAKIVRDAGNMADDPRYSDSVVRAMTARLKEICLWEQELLVAQVEVEKTSSILAKLRTFRTGSSTGGER